ANAWWGVSTGQFRSTSAAPGGFWNSVKKTSDRTIAIALALGVCLQLLPACATTPKISDSGDPASSTPAPSQSSSPQPSGPSGPSSPTTAGGSAGRTRPRTSSSDTVERATLMGFALGSPFGLIGAGAGTLLGFIYGTLTRRDAEAKAEVEAQRQETA